MTKIAQKVVFVSANYFLKIRVKSYVDQERAKKSEKNGADSLNRSKILWKNCRIFMCVFLIVLPKIHKNAVKTMFKGLNYGFNSIWGCRAIFPSIFFRKRASQSKISFSGYFLVGGDGSLEVVDNQWQKNSRQIGPKRVFLR